LQLSCATALPLRSEGQNLLLNRVEGVEVPVL
jgi:hypothetical protein